MPLSGPYILQTVQNMAPANTPNYYVAPPTAHDTPGKLGERAIDPSNGRTIFYTGDGTTHSWGSAELVPFPPSNP